jgi:hypothetical protein
VLCPKCEMVNPDGGNFCRSCGTEIKISSRVAVTENSVPVTTGSDESLMKTLAKDPDELTGKGIGNVIVGDGFLMVAVILSATNSSVSSLLWLFLLIPAFFFFGKGISDVLHARQIRQRLRKQEELSEAQKVVELPPVRATVVDVFKRSISGELIGVPSVTERTTRDLGARAAGGSPTSKK